MAAMPQGGPALPRVHGAPGERARFAGIVRALWPLLGAMFVTGVLVGGMFPPRPTVVWGLPLLLVAIIAFAVALGPGRRRINAFFSGARGEEVVGAALARLPAGFEIFHGVNLGSADAGMRRGSDIDHVVIGPSGAWVVETKAWNGEVTVSGGRILADGVAPSRPPVEQARKAAAQLAAWMRSNGLPDIPVRAAVCFAGAGGSGLRLALDGVEICGLASLLDVVGAPSGTPVDPARLARAAGLLAPLVDI